MGIGVTSDGQNLSLKGPTHLVDAVMLDEIRAMKSDLLAAVGEDRDAGNLSTEQRRFWALQNLHHFNASFNLQTALRVKGTIDTTNIQTAFRTVLAKHDILRRVFILAGDSLRTELLEPHMWQLRLVEVGEHETLNDLIAADFWAPFDLEREFPIRLTVLKIAADEYCLLFGVHHIASDARSLHIITNDFCFELLRKQGNACVEEVDRGLQYHDVAIDLERPGIATRSYWRKVLARYPKPADIGTRTNLFPNDKRAVETHFSLSLDLAREVSKIAREHRVSEQAVYLSAYALTLYRILGVSVLGIRVPVDMRTLQAANVVGPLSKALYLTFDFDESLCKAFIQSTFSLLTAGQAAGVVPDNMPFGGHDVNYDPSQELGFTFLTPMDRAVSENRLAQLQGLEIEQITDLYSEAYHALMLKVWPSAESVGVSLLWKRRLFDQDSIHTIFGIYRNTLIEVTRDIESISISDLRAIPLEVLSIAARGTGRPFRSTNVQDDLFVWVELDSVDDRDSTVQQGGAPNFPIFSMLTDSNSRLFQCNLLELNSENIKALFVDCAVDLQKKLLKVVTGRYRDFPVKLTFRDPMVNKQSTFIGVPAAGRSPAEIKQLAESLAA